MYRKNTAGQFVHFQGVDASTGGIKSGVTWTMRRCIDGTFAAGGGTVTEDSTNGWYKCALTQADTNGNNIAYNFTGTGAVPQTVNIVTTAGDPTDSVRFGLTGIANAAAGASGGLAIVGSAMTIDTTNRPGIRKNTALANFEILMTDSTNHNPATGLTVSVTRSIDGGAFAAGTLGSVTAVSNGIYKFDFGAGDLNGEVVTVRATATGADDLFFTIRTSP